MPEPLSDHLAIVDIVSGTPETGLWCGVCLLPSVIHVPVCTLTESGPQLLATYTQCDGCGAHPGTGVRGLTGRDPEAHPLP